MPIGEYGAREPGLALPIDLIREAIKSEQTILQLLAIPLIKHLKFASNGGKHHGKILDSKEDA
jgi:hypothetical protein